MRVCYSLIALLALTGCSLEDFGITPCLSQGRLAFRIHEIEGRMWDYQPRPSLVQVRVAGTGGTQPGTMWEASVDFEKSDKRPSRELMLYGQRLLEWDVQVRPKPLKAGTEYSAYMKDGGHSGEMRFFAGDPMPIC